MTMKRRLSAAMQIIASPGVFAHEFCHFIASLPWADEAAIVVGESQTATAEHVWMPSDDAPRWALIFVAAAPSLLGAVTGVLGLWRLHTAPPESATTLLIAFVAAAYWSLVIIPSVEDLELPDTQDDSTE